MSARARVHTYKSNSNSNSQQQQQMVDRRILLGVIGIITCCVRLVWILVMGDAPISIWSWIFMCIGMFLISVSIGVTLKSDHDRTGSLHWYRAQWVSNLASTYITMQLPSIMLTDIVHISLRVLAGLYLAHYIWDSHKTWMATTQRAEGDDETKKD